MSDQSTGPLLLNANFTSVSSSDRISIYRSHLMQYACEIVGSVIEKRSKQWQLLSFLEPGMLLFAFDDHQRLCFRKRADRITHTFRTFSSSRRLSHFSFRVLWIMQSPIFHEVLSKILPQIDCGIVYLTCCEATNTYALRVSWVDDLLLQPDEMLVQVLMTWGANSAEISKKYDKIDQSTTNDLSNLSVSTI